MYVFLFQFELVCDRKGLNKATATIFFVGVMLGAAIFGWLSDRWDLMYNMDQGPSWDIVSADATTACQVIS